MGIIKPTCSPPPSTPPPPPRDITAATRESVIVPSSRPRLSSVAPICLRRLPSEIGGTDGRAVRKRRVARGTNARTRAKGSDPDFIESIRDWRNGKTGETERASERGNRGNPSSFWCKASKSLQDPVPTARDRPGKPGYRGERVLGVGPLLRRTSSRRVRLGAATEAPPRRRRPSEL